VPNTAVVKFQNADQIDIVMDVPEKLVATVRPATGQSMVAQFSGAPGREFPVVIKEATQVADPKTQTFQVRVTMKRPTGFTALPGMTATVTVAYWPGGIPTNRMFVPVSAVVMLENGERVAWVMRPDQTVKPSTVKVGAVTGGEIEILEGLQPGERIVVAGLTSLRDGMKVRDLGNALGGPSL
jgi:RND family efflux transporter MFP subunit